ncbi:MAG TPA: DnaA N-terminal domain-containing protein [Chloroflexota bacterium]|jgi:hypothetical protein|nr:DnaA N-terminal domain-containing protein [Chloroflexota bacterium]
MPRNASEQPFVFGGFASPHYTQVPDDFFDLLLSELTPAEFKVCAYIIRRTFGWKKDSDAISLAQMVHGIRRRDGTYVDHGTGLHKETVITAIKGLLRKGVIVRQLNASAERGFEATTYALRLAGDPLSAEATSLVEDTDKGQIDPSSEAPTSLVEEADKGSLPPLSGFPTSPVGDSDPHQNSSQQRAVHQTASQEQTNQQTPARATAPAREPSANGADADTGALHREVDLPLSAERHRSTAMSPRQVWQVVLTELRGTMAPAAFETWVKNAIAVEHREGAFVIAAPNTFAREWLDTRLRKEIEAALSRVLGRSVALRVTVEESGRAPPRQRWQAGSAPPGAVRRRSAGRWGGAG